MIDTTNFNSSARRTRLRGATVEETYVRIQDVKGARRLALRLSEEATAKVNIHMGDTCDVLASPDLTTFVLKPGKSRVVKPVGMTQRAEITISTFASDYRKTHEPGRYKMTERWDLDQNDDWVIVLEEVKQA